MVVVPIKRLVLFSLCAISAVIISELIIAKVIGYPRFVLGTRVFALQPNLKPYTSLKWHAPYYKLWSVEGGNNVIAYNNLGFSGPTVAINDSTQFCFLLGNSYIEALQFQGSDTSAGVMQTEMNRAGNNLEVLNLGASAHDPYISWFRAKFFEAYFKPKKVVLVYERFDTLNRYFKRWQTALSFDISKSFGKELHYSKVKLITDKMRSASALVNLLVNLRDAKNEPRPVQRTNEVLIDQGYERTYKMLLSCLLKYKEAYSDRFVFVSLMKDNPYKEELAAFCAENNIEYHFNYSIIQPDNLIKGSGHLNANGNRELGIYLAHLTTSTAPTQNSTNK